MGVVPLASDQIYWFACVNAPAVVLADELTRHKSPEKAFTAFEHRRVSRTHYITNTSWRIGQMAQLTNPLLITLRNGLLRRVPTRMNERQAKTLYQVDF